MVSLVMRSLSSDAAHRCFAGLLLSVEPDNMQAQSLRTLIERAVTRDAYVGERIYQLLFSIANSRSWRYSFHLSTRCLYQESYADHAL